MIHSLATPQELKDGKSEQTHYAFTEEEAMELKSRLKKDLRTLQVDKYYKDPEQYNQNIALFSFIPSPGATPDTDGFYGFCKVRGVYCNETEADERAEYLIKNCDSYHHIFNCQVGAPFPLLKEANFAETVKRIDIRTKAAEVISQNIIEKKNEAKEELKTLKEKEERLQSESRHIQKGVFKEDPFDQYITQQVKRAQLIYGYHDMVDKLKVMKESYEKATEIINKLDNENPDFKEQYKEKYYKAREDAGLTLRDDTDKSGFIKYLGLDKGDIRWDTIELNDKK